MSLFEKNITILSQRVTKDFITEFDDKDDCCQYIGQDEDGTKVFCDSSGKPFIIEPVIDDKQKLNPNLRQIIFFFGIASLSEIRTVAQRVHKESLFVIIEPKPYFLYHALHFEDFEILKGLSYIIVTEKLSNLQAVLNVLFSSKLFLLPKVFYLNAYYRKYDGAIIREYINVIGTTIKSRYFTVGNSIYDSLVGLINNLKNVKAISENVDVARLKNIFKDVPAFVVAAGPSLDKNIHQLKKAKGKSLIIAVDTIAQKLIDNGITPDFVCSVERGAIVWDYFYKDRDYPADVRLVSSLVVDPRIVKKFKHKAILPMRSRVREYAWLAEQLNLTSDYFMWMGASCAHIAMGLALHVGASPIVMVGQDLAYGDKGTHAEGTVYEQKPLDEENDEIWVPGYYGGQVRTRKIWLEFKQLFETKFAEIDRLIINATEGGAEIKGAIPQKLADVIGRWCTHECNVSEILECVPNATIEWEDVEAKMKEYTRSLEKFRENVDEHLKRLRRYEKAWSDSMPEKKVQKIYNDMKKTDRFLKDLNADQLLYHNVQGPVAILMQKFHNIEEKDCLENLRENLLVQIELCEMLENTSWLILQVIEENYPWTEKQSD